MRRTMPSAETAIRLAQVLDVQVEWLITGIPRAESAVFLGNDDWLSLPHHPLAQIAAGDRSATTTMPVHRDWLTPEARRADALWATEMPATLNDGSVQAGDIIICHDADRHDREGSYLYFFNDMAVIRRFEGAALDAVREGRQTFDWRAVEAPEWRLVARILGSIKLRPL